MTCHWHDGNTISGNLPKGWSKRFLQYLHPMRAYCLASFDHSMDSNSIEKEAIRLFLVNCQLLTSWPWWCWLHPRPLLTVTRMRCLGGLLIWVRLRIWHSGQFSAFPFSLLLIKFFLRRASFSPILIHPFSLGVQNSSGGVRKGLLYWQLIYRLTLGFWLKQKH